MARNYRNKKADEWYLSLKSDWAKFPFSFVYDGTKYEGFGDGFVKKSEEIAVEGERETVNVSFEFLDKISVYLKLSHYYSHGVTEWTFSFENKGEGDTKLISEVKTTLAFDGANPRLRGSLGDYENKYRVYDRDLLEEKEIKFVSDSGRATHVNFPYFNLEFGNGGAMLAIGWAGTWTAEFVTEGDKTTYTAKSVNNLRSVLRPGEKIRTALFVVAPYTVRNEHYATNFWRSWFMEHNIPKADAEGNPIKPFSTSNFAFDGPAPYSDGSINETYETWRPTLEKMIEEDVKTDYRWLDAGWYVSPDLESATPWADDHDWWYTVGAWELDPKKWPGKTLLESVEATRAHGMKTIMWFEPERITHHHALAKNFGYNPDWAIVTYDTKRKRVSISNNIGDPDCYRWTVDRICRVLRENKIDMYREDNNTDPGYAWKILDEHEGKNRRGITECKFIDAHYRMWDEIRDCTKSYGGCAFVDSCAAGGGRNDLESMRRGLPLLRSDSDGISSCLRLSITTSMNKWIPFNGAAIREENPELGITSSSTDKYTWRCSYLPAFRFKTRYARSPQPDFEKMRYGIKMWKEISPYLLKEFYVLTPWHDYEDKTGFTSFAYYDDDTKKGYLFVFRREKCEMDTVDIKLPFIKDGTSVVLIDEDEGSVVTSTDGTLKVVLDKPRTSKQFFFEVK